MGLVGNGWVNCFGTHNELTMGLLGKYPLPPSDRDGHQAHIYQCYLTITSSITPPHQVIQHVTACLMNQRSTTSMR